MNQSESLLKTTDSGNTFVDQATILRLPSLAEVGMSPQLAQEKMATLLSFHKQITVDLPQALASSTELHTTLPQAVIANVVRKEITKIEQSTIGSSVWTS